MRLGKPLAHFSLEPHMQLPNAEHWLDAEVGPDKDGEVSDSAWEVIVQLCQQVERLEDEVARLKKA